MALIVSRRGDRWETGEMNISMWQGCVLYEGEGRGALVSTPLPRMDLRTLKGKVALLDFCQEPSQGVWTGK